MREIAPHSKRNYMNRTSTRYSPGKRAAQPKTGIRLPQLIFMVLLIIIVVCGGLFSWDRWFRYDDARDFQGQWALENTSSVVVIDEKGIALSTNLNYSYELDTWKKEITYSFGDLEGSGIYRFSPDRKRLIIIEGGTVDWWHDVRVALGQIPPEQGADLAKTTLLNKLFSGSDAGSGTPEPTAGGLAEFLGIAATATADAASGETPEGSGTTPESTGTTPEGQDGT